MVRGCHEPLHLRRLIPTRRGIELIGLVEHLHEPGHVVPFRSRDLRADLERVQVVVEGPARELERLALAIRLILARPLLVFLRQRQQLEVGQALERRAVL